MYNCQGLRSKLAELTSTVCATKSSLVLLTETWLDDTILDGELNIPGYVIYRSDRVIRQHGGVAIYVENNITVSSIERFASDLAEGIKLSLRTANDTVTVCCCYRSGNNGDDSNSALLEWITPSTENAWICAGDFNFPKIQWDSDSLDTGATQVDGDFLDFVITNNLTQMVNFPTRTVPGQRPAILDIVLISEHMHGYNLTSVPPLGKADHSGLLWETTHHMTGEKPQTERAQTPIKLNFFKADYHSINSELSKINWDDIFLASTDIEHDWASFKLNIESLISKYVPTSKHSRRNTPSLPKHILNEIRLKRTLWRHYTKTRQEQARTAFQAQRNKVVDLLRTFRKQKLEELVGDLKKNPKRFFSFLKSKQNIDAKAVSLADPQGGKTLDGKNVPGEFARQFNSVFHALSTKVQVEGPMWPTIIPTSQTLTALNSLDPNKACGPDRITNKFLRECAQTLAKPLAKLFSKSFSQGEIPLEWKQANITPIYKGKGSRLAAVNYRPVSLLCSISKICERLYLCLLNQELEDLGINDSTQHGFVKGRSCTTNHLSSRNKWTEAMDEGTPVDIFFADVEKAFDTAEHGTLIQHLCERGISVERLRWLVAFLYGREQRVVVNGEVSDWTPVTSGVPQGSVLGPQLFSLYTDESLKEINSDGWKFADDVKASNNIKSSTDHDSLQTDITTLHNWYKSHGLRLHPDKSVIMHLGHNNKRDDYFLDGTKLKAVEHIRDLGVTISSDLSVSRQCTEAASKAKRMAGFLSRNLPPLTPHEFAQVHKTLIRPLLEFSGASWTPWLRRDINTLESAQRLASRLLMSGTMSYEERLRAANLPTLVKRRERGSLIECFKIMRGFYTIDPDEFFTLANTSHLRGNSLKIYKPHVRLDVRKNFFSVGVISDWNDLPEEVCSAGSTNSFKNRLDKHMGTQ